VLYLYFQSLFKYAIYVSCYVMKLNFTTVRNVFQRICMHINVYLVYTRAHCK